LLNFLDAERHNTIIAKRNPLQKYYRKFDSPCYLQFHITYLTNLAMATELKFIYLTYQNAPIKITGATVQYVLGPGQPPQPWPQPLNPLQGNKVYTAIASGTSSISNVTLTLSSGASVTVALPGPGPGNTWAQVPIPDTVGSLVQSQNGQVVIIMDDEVSSER
jgi:hypothetical protein